MIKKLIRQFYRLILGLSTIVVLFTGALSEVHAGGPHPYLSYQGRLSDQNGNLLTGNYYITFCIYTSSSPGSNCSPAASPAAGAVGTLNSALWGETQYFSATNSPDNHIINGVFNAKLGTQSAFGSTLFTANSQLWIGVNVYNGSSWDGQMTNLQEIVSNGYSIDAGGLAVGTANDTASTTPGANNIPVLDGSGNLTLPSGGTLYVGGASGMNLTSTAITAPGALNVSSGGSAALTLTSKSGSVKLGASSNTITNTDASTDIILNPTGNLDFFNANSFFDSSGDLTIAGNLTLSSGYVTVTGGTNDTFTGENININSLAAPTTAPTLSDAGTGGSLSAGSYYGEYSWYNTQGETKVSSETASTITIAVNHKITFTLPVSIPTGATGAHLYLTPVNGASGTETQQSVNITSGTTGTVSSYNSGASPPTTNLAGGKLNTQNTITTSVTSDGFVGIILQNTNASATTAPSIKFDMNGTVRYIKEQNGTSNPQIAFLNNSQATVDTFDNNGEMIINAPNGYTGTLANFELNSTSELSVDYTGNVIAKGQITASGNNSYEYDSGGASNSNTISTTAGILLNSSHIDVTLNNTSDVMIQASIEYYGVNTGSAFTAGAIVWDLYRSASSSTCASSATDLTNGAGHWGEITSSTAASSYQNGLVYVDKSVAAGTYHYCFMFWDANSYAGPTSIKASLFMGIIII